MASVDLNNQGVKSSREIRDPSQSIPQQSQQDPDGYQLYDSQTGRGDRQFRWKAPSDAACDYGVHSDNAKHRLIESLSRSVAESFHRQYDQSQLQQNTKSVFFSAWETSSTLHGFYVSRAGDARVHLGRSRYLVVLIACYMAFLSNGFAGGLGVLYVPLLAEFNSSSAEAALVQSLADSTIFGGGVIAGMVVSRLGVGVSSIAGTIIATGGCLASVFAPSVSALIGTVGVLTGAGMSLLIVSAWSIIGHLAYTLPRCTATLLATSLALGPFLCPLLYSALLDLYDWRGVYLLIAAFNFHALPGSVFFYYIIRRTQRGVKTSPRTWRQLVADTVRPDLFRNWRYALYGAVLIPVFATIMAPTFFVVDIATDLGFSIQAGSLSLMVMGVTNVLARGLQGVLSHFNVSNVLQCAFYLLVLGVLAFGFTLVKDQTSLLAICAAYGFFYGPIGVGPPLVVYEELIGQDSYPAGIGYAGFFVGMGDLICGPLGGLIRDFTGSYWLLFYFATATCTISAAVHLLLACSCRGRQLSKYAPLTNDSADGKKPVADEKAILQRPRGSKFQYSQKGKRMHYESVTQI